MIVLSNHISVWLGGQRKLRMSGVLDVRVLMDASKEVEVLCKVCKARLGCVWPISLVGQSK